MWGWGSAWRGGRCFVGKVDYGVTFKLWNPKPGIWDKFGRKFRGGMLALLKLRNREKCVEAVRGTLTIVPGSGREYNNPWFYCPDDILFYILNVSEAARRRRVSLGGGRRWGRERRSVGRC